MEKYHIITRCTRLQNLLQIKENVYNCSENIEINWHLIFDVGPLKDIDAELLANLSDNKNTNIHFVKGTKNGLLYPEVSELISKIKEGWIYLLDDDNILHEDFYKETLKSINNNKDKSVHIFSQKVDKKDFTGLDIRVAKPENTKWQGIDIAQMLIKREIFDNFKFEANYSADGFFIEKVYAAHPNKFIWIKKILSYYNYLEKESTPKLPKILHIGPKQKKLTTTIIARGAAKELDVLYKKDDKDIISVLHSYKPDAIITEGKNWREFPNLGSMPLQFRRKWINLTTDKKHENIGDTAYRLSMAAMLDPTTLDDQSMISFFTPIYNTGDKLWETYNSFRKQTYQNIEWVLMNDSTDGGKTLKIAEQIAKLDPRVKVYDFREKSGGCIGEVKWRACAMAKGYIVAELDHDDLLVEDCAEYLHKAAQKHPECGFFFNDTALVNEKWESQKYPIPFALCYGSYRTETYNGKELAVVNQQNINPKTIRHIVGVPNHVRAWRRSTYFEIGGHNRELTVADDYELVVRTFLKTKICKIPKLGYIQFLYQGARRNTHDLSRADIQRRVRSIQQRYDLEIKARFEELGLEDWAYAEKPEYATFAEPRFGEEEGYANIIYKEEE